MGVPGFFAWIIKKYTKDILIADPLQQVQHLYLDWNGGIHPVCRSILAKYKDTAHKVNDIDDEMISEVIKYLQYVLAYVQPTETLFVAIDGVAPRAKMNQQRSRRFKSAKDKRIINEIKKKHKEYLDYDWDTNAITPGTNFMQKLCESIRQELSNNPIYLNLNVIFSDASIPMEGEHKIIEHIRKKRNQVCCIYGLDADLIFLSLLSPNEIYLLREKDQFSDVRGQKPFWYMNIASLKNKLSLELECDKNIQTDVIKDFIILCFFLGNDFIPKLPCLFIHNEGIDILIEEYKKIVNSEKLSLTKHDEINTEFLFKFLQNLSVTEGDRLHHFHKTNIQRMNYPPESSACQIELKNYDNIWPPESDDVKLGKKGWKDRYYKHFFAIDRFQNRQALKKIVFEYLKTIFWIWNYYTKGLPSWSWYYSYHHAPALSDISYVCNNCQMKTLQFEIDEPLTPHMQLLCVLPPQSFHLLPKKYHNIGMMMSSLYPTNFEEDCLHKKKRWQTIPNIPFIDIQLLKSYCSTIQH